MTGYEWAKWKSFLMEIYDVKIIQSNVDLHHLYSGGEIDTIIKKGKRSKEILKLFRNSILNMLPMEHNAHIKQDDLIKYRYEDLIRIYIYFNELEEVGIRALHNLNYGGNLNKEGMIKLLHIIIKDIFGELIHPFDHLSDTKNRRVGKVTIENSDDRIQEKKC